MAVHEDRVAQVRAYLEYFRDIGVHEFYRSGTLAAVELPSEAAVYPEPIAPKPVVLSAPAISVADALTPVELNIAKLVSFNDLAPVPEARVQPDDKAAALAAITRRVKAAMDPAGIFNPGRLYAGL